MIKSCNALRMKIPDLKPSICVHFDVRSRIKIVQVNRALGVTEIPVKPSHGNTRDRVCHDFLLFFEVIQN